MLLFLFLLGLIIGSFLNVVILRSEKEESFGGRSHCPQCQALIRWYDNIPLVSFLLLRGRCRQCQNPISWQYPLVELATGLTFLGIGHLFMDPITQALNTYIFSGVFHGWAVLAIFIGHLILASLLIIIFVSDLRTMEIPLLWLALALGTSLCLVALGTLVPSTDVGGLFQLSWQSQLLGGALAGLFFWALVFFSKETWMGKGDIWLAAVMGLTVGAEALLFALTLSFFLGALIGIGLLLFASKGWKSQIAFAPFLITALFLTWGIQWVNPVWFSLFLFPVEVLTLF